MGKHKTKKETVTAALEDYIRRRKNSDSWKSSGPSISIRSTTTRRKRRP